MLRLSSRDILIAIHKLSVRYILSVICRMSVRDLRIVLNFRDVLGIY